MVVRIIDEELGTEGYFWMEQNEDGSYNATRLHLNKKWGGKDYGKQADERAVSNLATEHGGGSEQSGRD